MTAFGCHAFFSKDNKVILSKQYKHILLFLYVPCLKFEWNILLSKIPQPILVLICHYALKNSGHLGLDKKCLHSALLYTMQSAKNNF